MDKVLLEVTDLKQWRYCPRIVWYRYCTPAIRPVTALMDQGRTNHQAEEGREERRSLRMYGLKAGERHFDVRLRSEGLGLRGRVDLAIAVPDRTSPGAQAVVVEYKDSEAPTGSHFKLQLTAYALLVEEAWQIPVTGGWIYKIPLRQAEAIKLTTSLRTQVTTTVATIQAAIGGEHMPDAPANRRPCITCEFRRFCNDVV
ncbi:CRISPR-associated protein Cas4 [Candidatus Chloroploca sp. M-50]|uniref:CRISPR-associated exonuclease Cas4 n=1 Tax=Candidatus Chloroploca mongolica TaxID=2528176 RepID=A0ABS4DD21_9CHLR|nr:CRISPR-associated protein Cas4 [Candidatus Chloroploca mongolica]MBP1467341.1 CRISPR-associated protein Cas4 [Candidatus Chloroploca mongolica]